MLTLESARPWYPASDPVHGFDHVLRVVHLAERLAQAEGADVEIVRAAALLHDANGDQPSVNSGQLAVDSHGPAASYSPAGYSPWGPWGNRLSHHHVSAGFAALVLRAEGWDEERIAAVQHCIRAHRFRLSGSPAGDRQETPRTVEAQVLFDADKLDAIGAVGVARAIGYALQAGQPAYAPPSAHFLETGELSPGEPHSAYHEYLFKLRRIQERLYTPAGRRLAEERHRLMAEFFEQLAKEMGESS